MFSQCYYWNRMLESYCKNRDKACFILQKKCLRRKLSIKLFRYVSNEEVLHRADEKDPRKITRRRKCRYFEHALRMNENLIPPRPCKCVLKEEKKRFRSKMTLRRTKQQVMRKSYVTWINMEEDSEDRTGGQRFSLSYAMGGTDRVSQ